MSEQQKFNSNLHQGSSAINETTNKSILSKDNNLDDSKISNHNKNLSNSRKYSTKKVSINESKIWGSKKTLNQIVESDENIIPKREENFTSAKKGNLRKSIIDSENPYMNEDSTKATNKNTLNPSIRKESNISVNRSLNFETSDDESDASFLIGQKNPRKLNLNSNNIKSQKKKNENIFLTSKTNNLNSIDHNQNNYNSLNQNNYKKINNLNINISNNYNKNKNTQKNLTNIASDLDNNLIDEIDEEEKLVLPDIKKKRNKSHYDILSLISKNLSSDMNNNNLNKSPQNSFILSDEREPDRKFSHNLMHDNTEINKGRFKKKMLSPTLEAPKHNNNRMIPQAQIFMKNFFSQCKYQTENVNSFMKEINKSIIPTKQELESKKELKKLVGITNQDVEKAQFMEDRKDGKSIRSVKLLGPPVVGTNKYSFGDKNDVILIGDVINKMKNKLANSCRDTINHRIDEYDPVAKERKKVKLQEEESRKRRKKQDDNCHEIEESMQVIEKRKLKLLEELKKKREKEEREQGL